MRKLWLRVAVLLGGCAAALAIGLSISGAAHADDRPRLLDGLVRGTVTDVLDNVLPDQPKRQPEKEPEDQGNDSGGKKRQQRDTPVRDVIEKVKDEVEDEIKETVGEVEGVVTAPMQDDEPTPGDATNPQPDAVADDSTDTEPASSGELPPPAATPDQARQALTLDPGGASASHTAPDSGGYTCGHPWHQQGNAIGINRRSLLQVGALRHITPVGSRYSTPYQPTPLGPDQDFTPAIASPYSPFGGTLQDATITARATQPRTTAVRIPGHGHTGHGLTHRPDPPSG